MSIALYLVLGLSALLDLTLGAWASVSWGSYVTAWRLSFGTSGGDPQLLGLVLGLALIFFAVLQGVALWWLREGKEAGHWIVISFGFYLILSSLITFLVFRQRIEFLFVDGLRGALLVILSTVVLRAPATVRELRLPERGPADRPRHRPAEEHRRGRDRRGDRDHASGRRPHGRRERTPSTSGRSEDGRPGPRRRSGEAERRPRVPRGAAPGWGDGENRRPERTPEQSEADGGNRIWSRKPEHHGRTPEELLASEPGPPRRPRLNGSEERPLTVVVKGDPDALRVRSLDEVEGALHLDAAAPRSDASEDREPSSDRHRRRRRHRPRSGVPEDRPMDAFASPEQREEDGPSAWEAERTMPERGSEEEMQREPRSSGPSGVVEAFDMLSLLDPASDRSDRSDQAFGRRSKRVAQKRPMPSPPPSNTDGHPPGHEDTV